MDTGWVTDAVMGSMGRKGVWGFVFDSLMLMFVMACCRSERSVVPASGADAPFIGTTEARGVM